MEAPVTTTRRPCRTCRLPVTLNTDTDRYEHDYQRGLDDLETVLAADADHAAIPEMRAR